MSFAISKYSVADFNGLDDFGDALSNFDNLSGQEIATGQMAELFRRHKVDNILGLSLLHNHTLLEDGEWLTDVRGTSNPLTFSVGTLSVWRVDPAGRALVPVEFSADDGSVD